MMSIPFHLSELFATGEHEKQPVAQFEIGTYKNFVYLILDWAERKAAIIDPQYDLSAPLGCIKRFGFDLSMILLTHTHFDHIAGVPRLIKEFPQTPLRVHRSELHRLDPSTLSRGKIFSVQDGDTLELGRLKIQVIHTPGHSAGECCYLLDGNPPYLFTGDTVFIRDCGRTDLESGSNEHMFHSLQKLKKLPRESLILPGHHYKPECASTLKDEMKNSPAFQCKTVEELAALP